MCISISFPFTKNTSYSVYNSCSMCMRNWPMHFLTCIWLCLYIYWRALEIKNSLLYLKTIVIRKIDKSEAVSYVYPAVPAGLVDTWVSISGDSLEMPKSATLATRFSSSKMLVGFTSLCITGGSWTAFESNDGPCQSYNKQMFYYQHNYISRILHSNALKNPVLLRRRSWNPTRLLCKSKPVKRDE